MKKLFFLLFFLFGVNVIYGSSIRLYNDSPYQLTAEVHSADGNVIGKITINPGENKYLNDFVHDELDVSYNSKYSQTPYAVVWRCSHGGIYSTNINVSPGSSVTATGGSGNYHCKPKEKKKK